LLLVLPFCKFLEAPFRAILVDTSGEVEPASLAQTGSVLDVRDIDNPQLAMGNLKRELLRMTELVERMFLPTLELFETKNPTMLKAVRDLDDQVNMALEGIRQYIAVLPTDGMTENEGKTVHSLMEYAIRLESAGDIVRKVLTSLAEEKHKKKVNFSAEGWKEIVRMHEAIEANLRLACNVLISDDLESARLLVIEKTEIQRSERESRKQHLQRLQNGLAQSFETSDIHLETLRALRDFNGHISAVANPILHRNGQLLESRLIMSVDKEAAKQI
jgi:phosphate:Na+ symporter